LCRGWGSDTIRSLENVKLVLTHIHTQTRTYTHTDTNTPPHTLSLSLSLSLSHTHTHTHTLDTRMYILLHTCQTGSCVCATNSDSNCMHVYG
jgi:hypothetical protein